MKIRRISITFVSILFETISFVQVKIIRGQQVMLDRDLATLYGVETKRLNEQVKRNIKRFPEDFMFQLTKDECLRSQIATLNEGSDKRIEDMHRLRLKHSVCHMTASFV